MHAINPPFRADHVGSLLRPPKLKEARRRAQLGAIAPEELRAAEDEAIREVVRRQEAVGLQSITDGEFRREFFHLDFLQRLQGVTTSAGAGVKFHTQQGDIALAPPLPDRCRADRGREGSGRRRAGSSAQPGHRQSHQLARHPGSVRGNRLRLRVQG